MRVNRSSPTTPGVRLRAMLCVFLALALNLYATLDLQLPGQPSAIRHTWTAVSHAPAVQAQRTGSRFSTAKQRVQTHAHWLVPATVHQLPGRSVAVNDPADLVVHSLDPATHQRGRAPPVRIS